MGSDCDNLDAYLLGDLAREEACRFERHLVTCADCRQAVDQQRWLDSLLKSPTRIELEPPPDGLARAIRASIAAQRQARRLVACGLGIAAALVVAVGWWLWPDRPHQVPPDGQVARSGGADLARPAADDAAKAIVAGDEDTIVVPVASQYPNVTVVRVYRTYRPARVNAPGAGDAYPDNNVSDPDYSNGG